MEDNTIITLQNEKYKIEKKIARGACGIVYKGVQLSNNETVAI